MIAPKSLTTAWALGVAVVAVALAACSNTGPNSDQAQSPVDVAQEFLRAQADGDYARALDLTTASASDFACEWQVSDGQSGGIAAPTVDEGSVVEDGDAATVDVQFTSVGVVDTSLALERGADGWLVVLPDSYRLDVVFDEPAVAELRFDIRGEDSRCAVPASGGTISMSAFPGTYAAHVVDPTGVADYGLGQNVKVTGGGAQEPLAMGAPFSDSQFTALGTEIYEAVQAGNMVCGPKAAPCPLGPSGSTDAAQFANELVVSRVWTDSGERWQVDATADGSSYMATLDRDQEDSLVLTFP